MRLPLASLQALHRCCSLLGQLRSGCAAQGGALHAALAQLEAAQAAHQAAFAAAYPGRVRSVIIET